jgi:hypothetical protein
VVALKTLAEATRSALKSTNLRCIGRNLFKGLDELHEVIEEIGEKKPESERSL